MKKNFLPPMFFTVGLFILSQFFYSCNDNPKNDAPEVTTIYRTDYKDTTSYGFGNLVDPAFAKECIENYEKVFRKHHKDTLTQGVWFSKEVIEYLDTTLKKDGTLDGVRFYIGCYKKDHEVPSQDYRNQFSIFGVATKKDPGGKHPNDWEALKDPTQNLVLNHGELCPNRCPTN